METTELTELSIMCLMGVLQAKAAALITLAGDIMECLCADCPPGEPGEVIAGEEGGVQVTAPAAEGETAGAITPQFNAVKGIKAIRQLREVK